MRNILALVDFSESSTAALKAAYYWSKQSGSKLHVFHKTELLTPGFIDNEIKHGLGESVVSEAQEAVYQLIETAIGTDIDQLQVHVTYKRLLPEFSELINKFQFDLVFLGVRNKGFLSGIFMGSTVLKIIENYSIPVAAIPKSYTTIGALNLFAGVSPNHQFGTDTLQKLIKPLGRNLNKLEFITVITKGDNITASKNYLVEISNVFSSLQQCGFRIFEGEDAFTELKGFMNENKGSMLVVQKGARAFDDIFFRKFLVNELVNDAGVPVIILP